MSKRKSKNKYRFQPIAAEPAVDTEQQAQLPLGALAEPEPVTPIAEVSTHSAPDAGPVVNAEPASVEVDADHAAQPSNAAPTAIVMEAPLGSRLRAAREARALTCEQAAHALKLPVTVVRALEAEQFDRIGHGVYLRGYMGKYLQFLGLPQVLAERVVHEHAEPPPLTTNGTISRPRYLFDRYSGSALYLILTAVFVVPAVLLALGVGFQENVARITPLDTAAPLAAAPMDVSKSPSPAAQAPATPVVPKLDDAPLVASMTPFPAAVEPIAPIESVQAAGTQRLHLSLTQASWVEIVDADGNKLEYGLLPAGSERDYTSKLALDVRIGNAEGATLQIDGKAQDLAAFRRANVAHLKVSAGVASAEHNAG